MCLCYDLYEKHLTMILLVCGGGIIVKEILTFLELAVADKIPYGQGDQKIWKNHPIFWKVPETVAKL